MSGLKPLVAELPIFDRKFWDGTFRCTQIGSGAIGGKASGLVFIKDLLAKETNSAFSPDVDINVPTMAVIATDCFDQFITQNHLAELPFEEMPDDRIAHAFQKGDLPVELLGDLRALIVQVKTPLAIRSSSLLEDALERPFAGVYATKMIPNNQPDPDARFRRLLEAIKFVYASTYFREARDYIRTTGTKPDEEEMAVILQEVVGQRRGDRFYPDISGVARSYNFYAFEPARPEEGVVTLALGLGKTIVDGGIAWTFSPAYPKKPPPFASVQELLKGTQTEFWAVNMGKAPAYDPVLLASFLNRVAWHQQGIGDSNPVTVKAPSGADKLTAGQLLEHVDTAVCALNGAESLAWTQAYLDNVGDRGPLVERIALAATKLGNDPHNQEIAQCMLMDFGTNRHPERDKLLLAAAYHTAMHRKYGDPLEPARRYGEAMGVALQ